MQQAAQAAGKQQAAAACRRIAPLALKSPSIMVKRASRRPSGSRTSSTSITASASSRHSTPWLQPRCRIHVCGRREGRAGTGCKGSVLDGGYPGRATD